MNSSAVSVLPLSLSGSQILFCCSHFNGVNAEYLASVTTWARYAWSAGQIHCSSIHPRLRSHLLTHNFLVKIF